MLTPMGLTACVSKHTTANSAYELQGLFLIDGTTGDLRETPDERVKVFGGHFFQAQSFYLFFEPSSLALTELVFVNGSDGVV